MDSTATVRRPTVLADLIPGDRVRDILIVLAGAAFVGALAQAVVPFTPVPMTGQTLGVLVVGCGLGWRRAAAAMVVYLVAGFAGVPWFASHHHGWGGPTLGYLFGFLLAATVCGYLAERGADRSIVSSIPTMLVGEFCIYIVGVPWLAASLHLGLRQAFDFGFNPFVAGDAVKLAIAAGLLPAAWKLAGRGRSPHDQGAEPS